MKAWLDSTLLPSDGFWCPLWGCSPCPQLTNEPFSPSLLASFRLLLKCSSRCTHLLSRWEEYWWKWEPQQMTKKEHYNWLHMRIVSKTKWRKTKLTGFLSRETKIDAIRNRVHLFSAVQLPRCKKPLQRPSLSSSERKVKIKFPANADGGLRPRPVPERWEPDTAPACTR